MAETKHGNPDLPPLREVIARHGLSARKSLGQNFLLDLNLTRRIARTAGSLAGETVIEIGPGPGGLTRALLESEARRVIAVETDPRCVEALGQLSDIHGDRLLVIEADAFEIDEPELLGADSGPVRVVANLPYNVATGLLIKWLSSADWPPWYASLTLMFQKEVAERLGAAPGTKTYGRLSVLAQWCCTVTKLFDIPPRAFVPQPRVTSSLVSLVPRKDRLEARREILERVTAAAFGQRRKMLRGSLGVLARGAGFDSATSLLDTAGLDGRRRPEDLSVSEFCVLARAVEDRGRKS